MMRRRGAPSPIWRSFLLNQAKVSLPSTCLSWLPHRLRLLYVMIILAHDRRKIVRFDVTLHPTAGWLSRQVTEAFPWDTGWWMPHVLMRTSEA
jgi:putative transposase